LVSDGFLLIEWGGVRGVNHEHSSGERPEVNLLAQLEQPKFQQKLVVDETVQIELLFLESSDIAVDFVHGVDEPFVSFEVLLQKVQQFAEVLLAAFEEDIGAVIGEELLKHLLEVDILLPQVNVQRDLPSLVAAVD